ncbi:RAN GTPase-activating protein 2 [Amborella trichopoda]|uniref:WPP domain-containing protein n=1 Tax=Amborella trichopoda TaxID=13333 RepID=W1NM73_AMBTC|nr:RAN GTPase-activating protein 2 [Amborella trichopoda]ERM96364.1 hypothetical protein AMTR_s00001p00229590 [Amborella trichopoda]|eukprot:XP_006828948.1 RAN GTPase-activating protein 2 [Amborella trichopoda]
METPAENLPPRTFSIKLWPPSQSTRLMLVERMTKNLSSVSIFSRKYGLLSKEEAEENAKRIEEVAFTAANEHHEKEPDGDGSSAVQLYAKESSKLMLEVLKRGPKSPKKESTEQKGPETDEASKAHKTVFDISDGARSFINEEEAEKLLEPLKEAGNSYTKIRFSNKSFGLGAAGVAVPILKSLNDQLREVDLSDFIAGRPEDEALEVMSMFASALEGCILRSLNLSNNALGEKGVRAFGALLKSQSELEELYFMNNGISEEAARAICELLPSVENLKVLHFHNNMTGDEGAVSLSELVRRSPSLEDFRCSSTRVGSEGGVALAEAVGTCPNLKKLDLRDNMFGTEAEVALAKALSGLNGIKEAYFSYLNLEDEGAVALAESLKDTAPMLEVLEMAGNDITAKAAPALAACLKVKESLSKLNLSENELKDKGTIVICKMLEEGHKDLKELDLSTNGITRVGAKVSAKAVAEKPGFSMLNLDGNCISDEGIDEVKEVLKEGVNGVSVLGPLDENEEDGDGDDNDEDEGSVDGQGDEDGEGEELQSKLQELKVDEDKE